MLHLRRARLAVLFLLTTAGALTGCQRGEKSCKYYSLVLDRSESAEEKRGAVEEIKKLGTADQLKCDDDKVYERFTKAIGDAKYRPLMIETLESLGKSSPNLRVRSEKLLIAGLKHNDAAAQIAGVVRTWRLESMESGKDTAWLPSKAIAKELGDTIKRVQQGAARGPLVEALFLAVPDPVERAQYEDLLIELADTDPASQTVEVNIKALQYLAEMRSQKDTAFDAYVHGLFLHDAARSETFMAARLALATFPRERVADKMIGIFTGKDADFEKWTKVAGLFDWEWKEGPKVIQILSDVHLAKTAPDILAALAKPVDVTPEGTPRTFGAVNKALPYAGYVVSRIQLSMWALAAMGTELDKHAEAIAAIAKNQGLGVEQRTMPLIALAVSGANNGWATVSKTFGEIAPPERGDFMTPMIYALDTQNLDDWTRIVGADTSEGVKIALADPTIVGRLKVVTECKKLEDSAPDGDTKKKALIDCYAGFVKNGTELEQEKAVINLVHLGARGSDVLLILMEAYRKSLPTSSTVRQILTAAFKNMGKPDHMRALYQVQQEQVQHGQNGQVWVWEFDVLLSHLFLAAGGKLPMPVNVPAPGAAPAAPAGAPAPAGAGAAPAEGAAPAAAAAPAPGVAPAP